MLNIVGGKWVYIFTAYFSFLGPYVAQLIEIFPREIHEQAYHARLIPLKLTVCDAKSQFINSHGISLFLPIYIFSTGYSTLSPKQARLNHTFE